MSSSVDFLVWSRGGIPGWVCLVLASGWIRIGHSYPLSDNRQLYRVSIGCLVHAAAAASVHHTYVGEDRRILASPCTGLSTDAPSFSLPFVGTPFV